YPRVPAGQAIPPGLCQTTPEAPFRPGRGPVRIGPTGDRDRPIAPVRPSGAAAVVRRAGMDQPKGPPKILIADDNQQNVELLEAYLAGIDCEIRTAHD